MKEFSDAGRDQLTVKPESISQFPTGMTQKLSVTAEVFSSAQVSNVVSSPAHGNRALINQASAPGYPIIEANT